MKALLDEGGCANIRRTYVPRLDAVVRLFGPEGHGEQRNFPCAARSRAGCRLGLPLMRSRTTKSVHNPDKRIRRFTVGFRRLFAVRIVQELGNIYGSGPYAGVLPFLRRHTDAAAYRGELKAKEHSHVKHGLPSVQL